MSRISHFLTGTTFPYGAGRPSPFDICPRSWNMPYRLVKAAAFLTQRNLLTLSGNGMKDILKSARKLSSLLERTSFSNLTSNEILWIIEDLIHYFADFKLRLPTFEEIKYLARTIAELFFILISVPPVTTCQMCYLVTDSILQYYGVKAPVNRNSWFIDAVSDEPVTDYRKELMLDSIPIKKGLRSHSHPDSAAERSAVCAAITDKITSAGLKPYDLSMSKSSEMSGYYGQRYFYWLKDYKCNFVEHPVTLQSCFVMIDVDYYVDMNEFLKYFRPIIIYTIQPQTLRYTSEEYSFRIDDGKIYYDVRGGAKYSHELWDYSTVGDTLSVTDWYGNQCVYSVEKQSVGKPDIGSSRMIIYLMPIRRIPWFCVNQPAQPLVRASYRLMSYRKPKTGLPGVVNAVWDLVEYYNSKGYNYILNIVDDYVELSEVGTFTSIRLKISEFESFLVRSELKTLKPGDVEILLKKRYHEKNGEQMPYDEIVTVPIVAKALSQVGHMLRSNVSPSNSIPLKPLNAARLDKQSFTIPGSTFYSTDRFPGQIISSCLVRQPAVLPARNINNNQASIKGRIAELHNAKQPTSLGGLPFSRLANEFVERLVERPGVGVEWTVDQVVEHQNKPMQRQRINDIINTFGARPDNRLTTFIKNEPYASVNDPRNITTMSSNFTLVASTITYSFKEDVLKHQPWYGPGKSPRDSVDILRNIASNGACLTDYSRYDGRVSRWLQNRIAKAAYLRWASAGDTREHVNHMFQQIFRQLGRTADGELYYAGHGTRSGSPITTDANTMINAFVAYCSFRVFGYDKQQAYALLGIYAGDDGVTPFRYGIDNVMQSVCSELGLVVKMEIAPVGGRINYLGRIFPSILISDISYQDLKRTLPKLHISTNQIVKREVAAVNKATGYLITDAITPILGTWAKRILQLNADILPTNFMSEEIYKIEHGAWPQPTELNDIEIMKDCICSDLDMTLVELEAFDTALRTSVDLTTRLDYFDFLWENDEPHKRTATLDQELVGTEQPTYSADLTTKEQLCKANDNNQTNVSPQSNNTSSSNPKSPDTQSASKDSNPIASGSRNGTQNRSPASRKPTKSSSHSRGPRSSPKRTDRSSKDSPQSKGRSTSGTSTR